MEDFQLRINQNFYHNKELEENELLEKQVEEGRERLEELNRLFAEANAIQLAKIRELEYSTKKSELDTERKALLDQLRTAQDNVKNIRTQIADTNKKIEMKFSEIINNISQSNNVPIEFESAGIKLQITQDQVAQGMRDEFKEDIRNGTFDLENAKPKIKNVFVKLGIAQLDEKNIEQTPQTLSEVNQMADRESDNYWNALNKDENINELKEIIQLRDDQNVALAKAESNEEAVKGKLAINDEKAKELNTEYGIQAGEEVVEEVADSAAVEEKLEDLKQRLNVSDDEFADPYAELDDQGNDNNLGDQNNNPNSPADDFPPPAGDPDNNNYPDQPPPSYVEASAALQQPAPSAPPEEEVDFPIPSAPPPEEAPIPNEPSPAYVGRSQSIQQSPVSIDPINNMEAKIAEPQPEKNVELKAPNTQPSQEKHDPQEKVSENKSSKPESSQSQIEKMLFGKQALEKAKLAALERDKEKAKLSAESKNSSKKPVSEVKRGADNLAYAKKPAEDEVKSDASIKGPRKP